MDQSLPDRQPQNTLEIAVTTPTPAQIREARESAGLSQTAAAALIHCSRSSWAEWEGGVSRMHPAFWELFSTKTRRTTKPG